LEDFDAGGGIAGEDDNRYPWWGAVGDFNSKREKLQNLTLGWEWLENSRLGDVYS
jgi:hypothetical protein